jgi:hypothetical protein
MTLAEVIEPSSLPTDAARASDIPSQSRTAGGSTTLLWILTPVPLVDSIRDMLTKIEAVFQRANALGPFDRWFAWSASGPHEDERNSRAGEHDRQRCRELL